MSKFTTYTPCKEALALPQDMRDAVKKFIAEKAKAEKAEDGWADCLFSYAMSTEYGVKDLYRISKDEKASKTIDTGGILAVIESSGD